MINKQLRLTGWDFGAEWRKIECLFTVCFKRICKLWICMWKITALKLISTHALYYVMRLLLKPGHEKSVSKFRADFWSERQTQGKLHGLLFSVSTAVKIHVLFHTFIVTVYCDWCMFGDFLTTTQTSTS